MRISTWTCLLSIWALKSRATDEPGYDCCPGCIEPTIPLSNNTFNFGQHYAVLNLDLINALVGSVSASAAGKSFIANTANWINAVHAQNPPPLSIFTRIYFSNFRKPELGPNTPFAQVAGALGTSSDNLTQIYPDFHVDAAAGDVVLEKVRYYAGAGNPLEIILRAQGIDTVILSGIRTSGVILSTVYQLFDLDYKVYVIANNTIEPPPKGPEINTAILEGIIPKLPADVITIEQALAALNRSGPAIY
ncbi:Isochorismatase-like protein [Xylariomycetidae sp. FL2044]|nr:Isochorismatase-like protein [Xylariomycetidae sp. FL2044]